MGNNLITLIIGTAVTGVFAITAYFLKRLIDQNDGFQDETRRTIGKIGQQLIKQKTEIAAFKHSLQERIEDCGFDQSSKAKISSIAASVAKVEKELQKINPVLENAQQDHGTVIYIQDLMKAQDKKLKGLYDAVLQLTKQAR